MPCNMMSDMEVQSGINSDNYAAMRKLHARVTELEQALCGVCHAVQSGSLLNQEAMAWLEKHRAKPGCAASTK